MAPLLLCSSQLHKAEFNPKRFLVNLYVSINNKKNSCNYNLIAYSLH